MRFCIHKGELISAEVFPPLPVLFFFASLGNSEMKEKMSVRTTSE